MRGVSLLAELFVNFRVYLFNVCTSCMRRVGMFGFEMSAFNVLPVELRFIGRFRH